MDVSVQEQSCMSCYMLLVSGTNKVDRIATNTFPSFGKTFHPVEKITLLDIRGQKCPRCHFLTILEV